MIDLTPLDVRKKKGDFRRGLRGYDPPHVDDFLDIVADRLEALVKENIALQERLARVEQQVADNREREKVLTDTLVTAQEMREEMRTQMTREAESARRQAEQDAGRIRAEATQAIEREEETLRRLRARQLQFLQAYRTFLERELSELASMAKTLELNGTMSEPLDSLKAPLPPLRES
ncbi:MAG: DivIVA domain-containing protein, partial [Longimicrobiales bacterium]